MNTTWHGWPSTHNRHQRTNAKANSNTPRLEQTRNRASKDKEKMKKHKTEGRQLALTNGASPAVRKPRKRPLGRRSLYSAQLQRRICQLLEKGNTIVASCDHVGIAEKTFYTWCEDHPQFLQATSRARGKARIRHVKTLTDAAKTDWRASAWLLSHCWPNEYSELVRNEVGVLGGIVLIPSKSEGPE
jgi:hypothetical protein